MSDRHKAKCEYASGKEKRLKVKIIKNCIGPHTIRTQGPPKLNPTLYNFI